MTIRNFILAVVVIASPMAWGQAILAVKVKPTEGNASLWIVKGGRATVIPDSEEFVPLSWSSDGRWMAVGKRQKTGWQLGLVDTTSADLSRFDLKGECSLPSWSPDGKAFVASVAGSGIRVCRLAGSEPTWSPLVPTGTNPAWSPTGGRIVFLGSKGEASGWSVSDEGLNPHAFFKRTGGTSCSWAPDGRSVAFQIATKTGRELVVVNAAGTSTQTVAEVDDSLTSWSPDGKSVLTKQRGRWVVIQPGTKDVFETEVSDPMPHWTDSRTLSVLRDGAVFNRILKTRSETAFSDPGLPPGKVLAIVPFRGLVLNGSFDNPWKKARPPHAGQIRLMGTVENIELSEDTATIKVWSVMTPDGMELHLATPLSQDVMVTSLSTRVRNGKDVRLSATDLTLDSEVMMLVKGSRAGVPQVLNIEHALIPDLSEEPELVANLFRPARVLEGDGVCMDHVQVDMTFPVLGKVNWSDTFLASRGGGSRRHHGQDLMAPKMRPLVATFDGVVRFNTSRAGHNTITLRGDQGWTAVYMHVNNDHPGTDDGKGGARNAFAPGLRSGDRVVRGQLVGYCGDSGNAEGTGPHCHFELRDDIGGGVLNATPSLSAASLITEPVYLSPPLDGQVGADELRWDVFVTKIDIERKVIVAELIGEQGHSVTSPKMVYIKLGEGSKVGLRSDARDARRFEDLKVGQFLTAVGRLSAKGDSLDCLRIGIGLSFGK